jgi:hypothetical protein
MKISEMKSKLYYAELRAADLLPEILRHDAAVATQVDQVAEVNEDGKVSIPDGTWIRLGTVREVRHPSSMCDGYLSLDVGFVYPTGEIRFKFRGNNGMLRGACHDAECGTDATIVSSLPHVELKMSAPKAVDGLSLRLRQANENKRLYGLLNEDNGVPPWFRFLVVEGLPKTTLTGWEARLEEREAQKAALAAMGLL